MNHSHNHKYCCDHDHDHGPQCACGHHHNHGNKASGWLRYFMPEIICFILFIFGFVMHHAGGFDTFARSAGWSGAGWQTVYFLLTLIPVAVPILKDTWMAYRNGDWMNEFTLMILASLGAFCIGEAPEGVAILLFYAFGEKMEQRASGRARERIKSLIGKMPETVRLMSGGKEHNVEPASVTVGSLVRVLPGERVCIDGNLDSPDEADFDTSAITGESLPRTVERGKEVKSGSIASDREVMIATTRKFSDSSMSRIMEMIDKSAARKAPTETLLRKITRWYTPIVMTAAILIFIIPWIISLCVPSFDFDASSYLNRSLVFLVCSCPCALVVSIPLSYFAAIGAASRLGILIKGGRYLDALRKVRTVFFDKTGTITTGKFHVASVQPADGIDNEYLVGLAAAADAGSTHPLAESILEYAAAFKIKAVPLTEVITVRHGIKAKDAEGREVLVGSPRMLTEAGVDVPQQDSEYSCVCVSAGGKFAGSILMTDTLKPGVALSIDELRREGVTQVSILSGDRQGAVDTACRKSGADECLGELLPEDKARIVEKRQSEGLTAFVGDGINDAPSLATADVGIAPGQMGSDVAIESADVIIAGDDLDKIPQAIKLAKRTRRVVIENVVFALGVKLLVMVLGAFGIATLWAAVFADTGITMITVAWSLTLLRKIKTDKQ